MRLARVAGHVVSTINAPVFDGKRLVLCDYLDAEGTSTGDYVIAVDVVGSGAGETVIILDEGTGARQILEVSTGPIRALVVGIVDDPT